MFEYIYYTYTAYNYYHISKYLMKAVDYGYKTCVVIKNISYYLTNKKINNENSEEIDEDWVEIKKRE